MLLEMELRLHESLRTIEKGTICCERIMTRLQAEAGKAKKEGGVFAEAWQARQVMEYETSPRLSTTARSLSIQTLSSQT